MSWNYRLIKHVKNTYVGEEVWYGIHEVHYNDDGTPKSMSTEPSYPYGTDIKELAESIENYVLATTKPILQYEGEGKKIVELIS